VGTRGPDEAGEVRVKRMALDGAEERARPRRGPCTLDSPTQCTSPELSFCTLIVVIHRHTDSLYFNDYRAPRGRDEFCKRALSSMLQYVTNFSTSIRNCIGVYIISTQKNLFIINTCVFVETLRRVEIDFIDGDANY